MATRSLNKIQLIGNLTRDPEMRYTAQGTAVATFGMATNRSWTDSDGQRQEEAEFHRVVAWAKLAEICEKLLFKGRKVYIEGRIQTRKWTDNDGNERETTEVVAENMLVLDSRNRDGASDDSDEWVDDEPSKDEETPKEDKKEEGEKSKSKSKKPKKEKDEEEVDVDDIPF